MSFSPLSTQTPASKLKVDLIENGIGTQALHETIVAYQAQPPLRHALDQDQGHRGRVRQEAVAPKGHRQRPFGYASSPVWSGAAGVVFGPHPRDYSKKTNKMVKQLALRKAISSRVNAGEVYLIEPISLSAPKTRDLMAKFKGELEKKTTALLVIEEPDQNLYLASRNHPHLVTVTGDQVNAEQILLCDKIFITEGRAWARSPPDSRNNPMRDPTPHRQIGPRNRKRARPSRKSTTSTC